MAFTFVASLSSSKEKGIFLPAVRRAGQLHGDVERDGVLRGIKRCGGHLGVVLFELFYETVVRSLLR